MVWFLYTGCIVLSSFLGASSLKCNWCAGSLTSDCANGVTSAMAVQKCNYFPKEDTLETTTATTSTMVPINNNDVVDDNEGTDDQEKSDGPKLYTYCVHLELDDDGNTTANVQRGCGYLYGEMDICNFIKIKYSNLKSCEFCTTDQCN